MIHFSASVSSIRTRSPPHAPSARLAHIQQLVSASTSTVQASLSSPNSTLPPVTLERHSSPQSQSNLQGEYLEQSQRSRTPSEKGALLVASNAQQDKLWRVLSAGELVTLRRPLVRPPEVLNLAMKVSLTKHKPNTPNSQDLTNQEETLADGPTLQQVIRSLPPPSVHGSLTVISSSQPVATGSGHHITHPAITKSEANDTVDQRKSIEGQAPSDEHALSDTKTDVPEAEDNQSFLAPTSAQPPRQSRSSIFITSSPFASPHSSRPPSPLSQQDPQVPPEDTQTVPEDLEVDQVNIQTVPKTSTQHPVSDIAGPTTRTLSQASPVSLGAPTSDPPHSPITTTTANRLQSSTQAPPSQHARVTQVQPATNRCRRVSQPAPPTGTQPEPINVADGLPPTRGRTRTRGGRGRGSAVRVGEGLHVMSPGERAIPRNLGIRREGALVVPAPTLPDISLQRNSQSIGIASQPRTQTPSASQQTSNPPNRPPTAPAPRTTPGPSNINQPDRAPTTPRVSGTCPPTGNRQPPPKTLAVTRPTPENGAELVLDDDEEQAAEAAVAQGREPNHRRRKPSSRNTHGVSRLVLQLAKLHFWAYALAEGPYQTRAVFITWVRVLWRETWLMEAPGTPFRDITNKEIQVVIAGLVTKRGRAKEQLRSAIEFLLGFNRFAMTPEEVALNISAFQRHHPNSFHCLEQEPERRGHYESELMHHAFALALFHNEGAVGVVFSEYFEDLAPATVAFILANIQFCLEEWSTGKHENRDLGTGQMLAKFESHLMAWNEFRRTAPRRARALTCEWFEYGLHYSNATQPVEEQGLLPSQVAEFRADTPTAEEPNQSLMRGGEESGKGLIQEVDEEMADLWTQEWVDDDEWEQVQEDDKGMEGGKSGDEENNAALTAEEPVEYNDDGRISARSKGKGPATH
ncbi:hypothetical protein RHS01_10329 [Rhizoctonia solani]|uniref:DUF6532 domain-containing protein n=1 Tax=Rhizoctonia solani TaxID=456999 RepID=A0A8H7M2L1_9AGAM|nr:hypothetical protein RHS01_10329 [Rhizoctonia solani]